MPSVIESSEVLICGQRPIELGLDDGILDKEKFDQEIARISEGPNRFQPKRFVIVEGGGLNSPALLIGSNKEIDHTTMYDAAMITYPGSMIVCAGFYDQDRRVFERYSRGLDTRGILTKENSNNYMQKKLQPILEGTGLAVVIND